jgi:hypothetical protein
VAEPSRFDTEPGDNGEVCRPGVSALFLRRNGIRHVDEMEAELRVGYKKAGILIPYSGLNVSQLMVNGRHYCRLRLDRPTSDAKYLSPRDSGSQLYIPQGAPFGPELVICEGEFKSLALAEAGVRAVAIGGISSAMPEGELLPDLSKILRKFNPGAVSREMPTPASSLNSASRRSNLPKRYRPDARCGYRAFRSQCPMASMMSDKS